MTTKLEPLIDGIDIKLQRGEKVSIVRNNITGDQYYTSNLYTKYIDGIEFIGVFQKPIDPQHRRINWMKRDQLVKVKW
jgi:hypothetical protein